MIGIIVVTHGHVGQALVEAAEMIAGQQENLHAISLNPDNNLDALRHKIGEVMQAADTGQGVLVLVDLFGGTPANAVAANLQSHEFHCLCGVNLPMLLEACLLREQMPLPELTKHVEKAARRSVANLRTALERVLHNNTPGAKEI